MIVHKLLFTLAAIVIALYLWFKPTETIIVFIQVVSWIVLFMLVKAAWEKKGS